MSSIKAQLNEKRINEARSKLDQMIRYHQTRLDSYRERAAMATPGEAITWNGYAAETQDHINDLCSVLATLDGRQSRASDVLDVARLAREAAGDAT